MKSYFSVFFLFIFCIGSSFAQEDEKGGYYLSDYTLRNGISMKISLSSPGPSYGLDSLSFGPSNFGTGFLFGIQIGHHWYIRKKEKFAIGILANWADISIATSRGKDKFNNGINGSLKRTTIDLSLLEVGPIVSFRINRKSAFDAYLNFRQTFFYSSIVDQTVSARNGIRSTSYTPSFAIGAGYRYNLFYIGPELVIGKLKNKKVVDESDFNRVFYNSDLQMTHLRIVVGFIWL